jgi:serine protease
MNVRSIFVICIVFYAANSFAQQQTVPGRILFRITPEAVAAFRSAFSSLEINAPKFDPQKFSLKNAEAITSLLGLPASLNATSVKPYIPQHNVVLEALRERTNPTLFPKINSNGIGMKESEDLMKLRTSEEHISRWFELFYDGKMSAESVMIFLRKSGLVELCEPRYRYSLCYTPNDPDFSQQYALPMMHVPEAWDVVRCDSTMLIADDDIGSDWTHSDLAKAIFINYGEMGTDSNGFPKNANGIDDDSDGFIDNWHGWDFAGDDGTAPDNDPNTPASHGTHTAGIMGASGNNSIGICGVAFGAKLLILKCGDNSGSDVSFGYEGIVYAADHGAKVVNNSWGGTNRSQVGQDIVDYAVSKNCVVVAASGNSYAFQDFYPASYDHVLSVAAVDEGANITPFSNYNTRVSISAPGQDILSTIPGNGYQNMSGTSMASPNAAAAIAMVRQKYPGLSPDQAVQWLRATSTPLNPTQDIHPGFTGKGLVNLKQAVTQSPVYSARLESVEVLDQQNTGTLQSGGSADIVLHVRNYLAPLTDLIGTIEYLNDTANAISVNTQTVQFGKANTLSLVQNFQGSYHVNIASNAPDNYTILVRITFISTPENYGPDIDYFYLVINKGYLDLNKNNLTVTFDSKADIGYNDAPNNTEGSGFLWQTPPPVITVEGRDLLSEAGLMIGIQDSVRIVSAAPGEASDSYCMQDFGTTLPIHYVTPADHPNAAQELHTIFADNNTDPTLQAGVTVEQKNYAFTKDLAANAVVVDYVIHRRVVDTMCYLTDSTAAALFMDWDIGPSGSINQAYISGLDTALSIVRRMEDNYPYIGVKIISDLPKGSQLNIYELDNNGANGSVSTYDGLTRVEKWTSMTTQRPLAGIGDVSMVCGLKNLPLHSQDSVRITFVIGLAENEALLKQTIDQTRNEWFNTSAVRTSVQAVNLLLASPNPFGSHLHLAWKTQTPEAMAIITITDAIGRTVFSQSTSGSEFDLNRLVLPAGAYTVSIESGSIVLRRQLISMP